MKNIFQYILSRYQPDNCTVDIKKLLELLYYFPINNLDSSSEVDDYLLDLYKIVVDNYVAKNYQVAYFYAHLILMSYAYYSLAKGTNFFRERMNDVYFPINTYGGRGKKRKLDCEESIYEFSTVPEKEIFKIFYAMGMEETEIASITSYVGHRDDYAHATGKPKMGIDDFDTELRAIKSHMEKIHNVFNEKIKEIYVDYLVASYSLDYQDFYDSIADFIYDNRISYQDLSCILKIGLSKLRDDNEEIDKNFRFIKAIHTVFAEYCGDNVLLDILPSNIDMDYPNYIFLKYRNEPEKYLEEHLGIYEYELGKCGEALPIYSCPECGLEQLVFNPKKGKYQCLNCGIEQKADDIKFCTECGAAYKDNDMSICDNCFEYKCSRD